MKALRWARVVLSPRAVAVLETLDAAQQARFWRIVSVIKNAPEDGAFFMDDGQQGIIRQMTGGDTHVIYRVVFWSVGRVLQIVMIEIRDWVMPDS